MRSYEFERRKKMLISYFNSDYKWKTNYEGEYVYYKGKRNLEELKFIVDVVFDYELEVLSEEYCLNDEGKVIGGALIL